MMPPMRLAILLGPDLKDALATDPDGLHDALEGFHPEDIAEIVDVPLGTVKSRLHAAVASFRDAYQTAVKEIKKDEL